MSVVRATLPRPTMVLALRITAESYDKYLMLPAKTHHKYEKVRNDVIFVPIDSKENWGWMERKYFDSQYEAIEHWSKTRFTLCKAK